MLLYWLRRKDWQTEQIKSKSPMGICCTVVLITQLKTKFIYVTPKYTLDLNLLNEGNSTSEVSKWNPNVTWDYAFSHLLHPWSLAIRNLKIKWSCFIRCPRSYLVTSWSFPEFPPLPAISLVSAQTKLWTERPLPDFKLR